MNLMERQFLGLIDFEVHLNEKCLVEAAIAVGNVLISGVACGDALCTSSHCCVATDMNQSKTLCEEVESDDEPESEDERIIMVAERSSCEPCTIYEGRHDISIVGSPPDSACSMSLEGSSMKYVEERVGEEIKRGMGILIRGYSVDSLLKKMEVPKKEIGGVGSLIMKGLSGGVASSLDLSVLSDALDEDWGRIGATCRMRQGGELILRRRQFFFIIL